MENKIISTVKEYANNGGLLWLDSSTLPPHEQFLATTDDDSYISDLYDSCRETGLGGTIDEFCEYCERQALDWAKDHVSQAVYSLLESILDMGASELAFLAKHPTIIEADKNCGVQSCCSPCMYRYCNQNWEEHYCVYPRKEREVL